jgi:hypothetical protein
LDRWREGGREGGRRGRKEGGREGYRSAKRHEGCLATVQATHRPPPKTPTHTRRLGARRRRGGGRRLFGSSDWATPRCYPHSNTSLGDHRMSSERGTFYLFIGNDLNQNPNYVCCYEIIYHEP